MEEGVRRILESRTMERAPTLRTLLLYLWQHHNEPISEYAIATEALGRPASFDARTDATVRVQISRLRQRVEKFYEQDGKECRERIVIPLGSHALRLETLAAARPLAIDMPAGQPNPLNRVLAVACAGLALISLGLAAALLQTKMSHAAAKAAVPGFWQRFFSDGRSTRIILPTPVFFSFPKAAGQDGSTIMVRETSVNEFRQTAPIPLLAELEKKFGTPELAQNYTVTSDTFASANLVRYLDGFSLATNLRSSADAPLEALDSENVIAIGTWGTLSPLKIYLDRMSLALEPHETSVTVRNPKPGEPAHVDFAAENAARGWWPGVVAVLPGHDRRTRLLILASRHTSALVAALTSGTSLDQIERLWRSKASPEYFEMIVTAEMDGRDLVRTTPVLLRPIVP
ncbi:MAG: winged helix-turn-helix domain-containing protein [Acidobacteriota bacterium]|nr:winged helix-turn-helix domain-containing protein [Acidobacteriota bacterium]